MADVIGFIDCVCSDFPDYKVCVFGDLNFECSSTDLGYSLFSDFATKLNLLDDLVNNNIDYTYHHAILGHKSWLDHMFIADIMKQLSAILPLSTVSLITLTIYP